MNHENDADEVPSPCVSNCCLDDKDICLGCFRHMDEIIGWHGASRAERLVILDNARQRREAGSSRKG